MRKACNHIGFALLAFAISFIAISCTSDDEFFGFEDENIKAPESNIFTSKRNYLDYETHLPIDSERNLVIYSEAFERLTIFFDEKRIIVKEKSGNEVSISECLFADVNKSIDALNYSLGYSDKRDNNLKRQLSSNPEGVHYNNRNCPCYAITYFLYGNVSQKNLKKVDEKLYQKYGTRYEIGDLRTNEVPEAVHECDNTRNVSLQTQLSLGYSRALLCTESGMINDTIIGHMSVITGIRDPNNGGNYYILGFVNPEVSTTVNYVNINKDLSVPLKNPSGTTSLFSSYIFK